MSMQQKVPLYKCNRQVLTLTAHGTLPSRRVLLDPLDDAVLMEVVAALARDCASCQVRLVVAHKQEQKRDVRRAQSSPGNLHEGQEPSKWIWQMPQTSSSGMSQRHVATAAHFLILTFMMVEWKVVWAR